MAHEHKINTMFVYVSYVEVFICFICGSFYLFHNYVEVLICFICGSLYMFHMWKFLYTHIFKKCYILNTCRLTHTKLILIERTFSTKLTVLLLTFTITHLPLVSLGCLDLSGRFALYSIFNLDFLVENT